MNFRKILNFYLNNVCNSKKMFKFYSILYSINFVQQHLQFANKLEHNFVPKTSTVRQQFLFSLDKFV